MTVKNWASVVERIKRILLANWNRGVALYNNFKLMIHKN